MFPISYRLIVEGTYKAFQYEKEWKLNFESNDSVYEPKEMAAETSEYNVVEPIVFTVLLYNV